MSLQEILRIQNERRARVQTTYEKIFERVKIRINHSAKYGATSCYYDIPQLLYGLPSCDLREAGNFVYKKLRKEGFLVHKITDTMLLINWDSAALDEYKAKKEHQEHQRQLDEIEESRAMEAIEFLANTK